MRDCFYHGVTVICIAVPIESWEYDFDEVWYLDDIFELNSTIYNFYYSEEDEENIGKLDITIIKDCLVRVTENNEIKIYLQEEEEEGER